MHVDAGAAWRLAGGHVRRLVTYLGPLRAGDPIEPDTPSLRDKGLFEGVRMATTPVWRYSSCPRRPPRQLCPTRVTNAAPILPLSGRTEPASVIDTLSRSATWATAIIACCHTPGWCNMDFAGRHLRGGELCGGGPPRGAEHCRPLDGTCVMASRSSRRHALPHVRAAETLWPSETAMMHCTLVARAQSGLSSALRRRWTISEPPHGPHGVLFWSTLEPALTDWGESAMRVQGAVSTTEPARACT
ncbi:hypothetical protein GWK47_026807 [Chionoecetes opilio]|uniref:Uncharacterized protein n=1 Tax=Chionoecetes opilio TaxID=41210 RepID=A0A8J8WLV8_CHIOP|nr:hypothetical protein GWK47_026807 [Chionoecetes opilio]